MILALSSMSPTWQAVLYGLAVICLLLSAVGVRAGRVETVALGLAAFVFVAFWNAVAAA